MQTNDTKDDEGQQEVEREEPVQGRVIHREATPQPSDNWIANDWYRGE